MTIFRCSECNLKFHAQLTIAHSVTNTLHVCEYCYDKDPALQKAAARFEDSQSDARLEEAEHDHAAEIYDKYSW